MIEYTFTEITAPGKDKFPLTGDKETYKTERYKGTFQSKSKRKKLLFFQLLKIEPDVNFANVDDLHFKIFRK